jgi:hypothetical protein
LQAMAVRRQISTSFAQTKPACLANSKFGALICVETTLSIYPCSTFRSFEPFSRPNRASKIYLKHLPCWHNHPSFLHPRGKRIATSAQVFIEARGRATMVPTRTTSDDLTADGALGAKSVLTSTQKAQFDKDGFIIVRNLLDRVSLLTRK